MLPFAEAIDGRLGLGWCPKHPAAHIPADTHSGTADHHGSPRACRWQQGRDIWTDEGGHRNCCR